MMSTYYNPNYCTGPERQRGGRKRERERERDKEREGNLIFIRAPELNKGNPLHCCVVMATY